MSTEANLFPDGKPPQSSLGNEVEIKPVSEVSAKEILAQAEQEMNAKFTAKVRKVLSRGA